MQESVADSRAAVQSRRHRRCIPGLLVYLWDEASTHGTASPSPPLRYASGELARGAAMPQQEEADVLILHAEWAITVDASRRVIRDAGIAIKAGSFAAVGKSDEIERTWRSPNVLSARGMVATPGFVDAHLHSSFSLARGLADESNAQAFLFQHMYPYEAVLSEEDVYTAVALACAEMLRHGVTCFVEPGNYHPDGTVRAAMAAGRRVGRGGGGLAKKKTG